MTQSPWQSFNERVAWEGEVHVACETVAEAPAPLERLRLGRLNAGVLAAIGMLGDDGDTPSNDVVASALLRVDAKLDILLELFNRYLLDRVSLPRKYSVRLNSNGILVTGFALPEVGTRVRVLAYFKACAGIPMELPGRVEPAASSARTFVHFDQLADDVRQGLEHLIFRQQRRRLSEARNAPDQPTP